MSIAEYDLLTRTELVQLIVQMRAENAKLHSAIARVQLLHENDGYGSCVHCLMNGEIEDGLCEAHPCPTLRALDGE